ncbi:MAG: hypothetical protein HYU28_08070 [Actinobacteria bacterium]|nr:hypothetical protein [Actinomycetota bacterium]
MDKVGPERELAAGLGLAAAMAGGVALAWVVIVPAVVGFAVLAIALGTWASARGEHPVVGSIAVGIGVADLLALFALWVTA